MPLAHGRANETEAPVKGFGFFVHGVGQKRSDAGLFGNEECSSNVGILQHTHAEPTAVAIADMAGQEEVTLELAVLSLQRAKFFELLSTEYDW